MCHTDLCALFIFFPEALKSSDSRSDTLLYVHHLFKNQNKGLES